jgi:hypothetical protein
MPSFHTKSHPLKCCRSREKCVQSCTQKILTNCARAWTTLSCTVHHLDFVCKACSSGLAQLRTALVTTATAFTLAHLIHGLLVRSWPVVGSQMGVRWFCKVGQITSLYKHSDRKLSRTRPQEKPTPAPWIFLACKSYTIVFPAAACQVPTKRVHRTAIESNCQSSQSHGPAPRSTEQRRLCLPMMVTVSR